MTDSHQGRIDILDYARFVAAGLVMGFHYFFVGIKWKHTPGLGYSSGWSNAFQFGHVGVSLFFMISGYVIFFSSRGRTAAQFASARVLRLYPAFLAALVVTTVVLCLFGRADEVVHPLQFLQNLTMLATDLGGAYADPSYWTLRLEISFYALVFLMILVGAGSWLERFFLVWPVIILAAQATPLRYWLLLDLNFSFFAAGALFAIRRTRRGPLPIALLCLCFIESITYIGAFVQAFDTTGKVMLSAVTAFYLFFVLLNRAAVLRIRLPAARLVGALTYPLYLLHQQVGYVFIRSVATPGNKVAVTLAAMAVLLLVAYLLHRVVEVNGKAISKRIIARVVGTPVARIEALLRPRDAKVGQGTSV